MSQSIEQWRKAIREGAPHARYSIAYVTGLLASLAAAEEREQRLRDALREIEAATATDAVPRCRWCGFDIGDCSETPGHAAACPTAIARATLALDRNDPRLSAIGDEGGDDG